MGIRIELGLMYHRLLLIEIRVREICIGALKDQQVMVEDIRNMMSINVHIVVV
jgi:hypothetical protein